MYIREGFAGQRLYVMPRPLVRKALKMPVTSQLVVTDVGFFPTARGHGRRRERGVDQAIVILCTRGEGGCDLASGRHRVTAGQALVIPPGAPHFYWADDTHPWTIWWIHLAGSGVGGLLEAGGFGVERPVIDLADPLHAGALVDEALTRLEADESRPSLLASTGAAWHLLALFAADQRQVTTHIDPIAEARRLLQEQSAEHISVPELAELAGLSTSHFAALFRRTTGLSVLEYQTRQRMARARDLLDTTDLTVAEIGRGVGYTDPFYFSRQFRKIHQVSPTEYRASAKG